MTMRALSRRGSWIVALMACPLLLGCGKADLASQQAIGRPCDLAVDAGSSQAVYNANASECPTSLCLKPALADGANLPSPPTGASCTGECTQDSDCAGELRDSVSPLDARCKSGFACAVPFEVGALACKKLCVCKDFFTPTGLGTPLACANLPDPPLASKPIGVGETSHASINLTLARQLDLLIMIDNSSPSMAPKVAKLNAGFPSLIAALKDPLDGSLPDLHIALIDSDLGTGGAYNSGACGPKTMADGTVSFFGDLGKFQMPSAPTPCAFTPGALYLDSQAGAANFMGDISSVFACLTNNLGTAGCGDAHQLQAFEFALLGPKGPTQLAAVRPTAQLALIFLSDKDDCSAEPNDGMFGAIPGLQGETLGLRCATRAHACSGRNLTGAPPGYPTTAAFSDAFSNCVARADSCPDSLDPGSPSQDVSKPTSCSPLRDVRRIANEIKALKSNPDAQILVAGIFGWPMSDADLASAEYKIAPIPNPDPADTANPTLFASWPVCYDPNHRPAAATTDPVTGFDATAAAWGATGGLRESAFVDEFGANGMKLSICSPDLSPAMASIGQALARKVKNVCFNAKLVDVDPLTPGLQPDCRVVYRRVPVTTAGLVTYIEDPASLPSCPYGASDGAVAEDCWQLSTDTAQCPASGQRISVLRTSAEIAAGPYPDGTLLDMHCQTCPALPAGAAPSTGCDY